MKSISLIIVNYYSKNLIEELLKTLPEVIKKEGEIIIVNNSPDEEIYFKEYENLKVINNEGNLGFGKAVNIGVKESKGEYLVIVNPDVKFIKGFKKALEFIKKNKRISMVFPLIIDKEGKKGVFFREMEYGFRTFIWMMGYDEFLEKKERRRIKERYISSFPMCCCLIPSKIFKKIGGFDESFFLFKEDEDFERRLRRENLYLYFYPEWVVYHEFGATHEESDFAFYHRVMSLYLFYKKHQKYFYPVIRVLLPIFLLLKFFLRKCDLKYFLISLNLYNKLLRHILYLLYF